MKSYSVKPCKLVTLFNRKLLKIIMHRPKSPPLKVFAYETVQLHTLKGPEVFVIFLRISRDKTLK